MKAAVLTNPCIMTVMELPIPQINDDEVLIRNKACAICNATDMKLFKGIHDSSCFPCIIGHEGAGIVEAVGKKVEGIMPGDRVLGGSYPKSPDMGSVWGQFSEYGIRKAKGIVFIPDNVSYVQATCTLMLAEALNAVRIGEIKPGDNILILGSGAVGISLLTLLKHTFPNTIIMVDVLEEKLETARILGADIALNVNDPLLQEKINEATEGKGVNKLYEAVGIPDTYNLAFDLIAYGGKLIGFGLIEKTLEIPFKKLYKKEIQFRWCYAGGVEIKENRKIILNMMSKGIIDVNPLITSIVHLDRLTEGLKSVASGKQIRVVVEI